MCSRLSEGFSNGKGFSRVLRQGLWRKYFAPPSFESQTWTRGQLHCFDLITLCLGMTEARNWRRRQRRLASGGGGRKVKEGEERWQAGAMGWACG